MRDIRDALADPLTMLALVSTLLAVVDPRSADPFARVPERSREQMTRAKLIESFVAVERPETSALLAAIAAMSADAAERRRLEQVVAGRGERLPEWLTGLPMAVADRAVEMTHVLGDGTNVLVGVNLPTGHALSVVLYVDHNLGTVAKDGFVVADPLAELIGFMRSKNDDPDMRWTDVDRADARARIDEAIAHGGITYPRFETDTWPAARVLVEWAARLLPEGGAGYVRPRWPDPARQELADRFLASRHAAALDRRDAPGLLESLLWFGCDYGPGDPMRWSPTAVEILLGDWIPRKIVADVAYLRKAPAVLRAFIRFCHEEWGIRPMLTAETLAAVDLCEPEYQATIRSARLQGAEAILAAVGALDPDTPWPPFERAALDALIVERLERAVGGPQPLATLGEDPLPDEPFDWNDVAEDIRDRVTEVVTLCDEYCETVLDIEYRTAARRLLAAVASGDPAVFRRKARADTAAAAICWIIGKANELFEPSAGGMLAKDLTAHFGSNGGSPSQRAATLLRAAGLRDATYGTIALDSPRYLVSAQRRRIIERRDRYGD